MMYLGKIDKKGLVGGAYKEIAYAGSTHFKVKGETRFVEFGEVKGIYQPTDRYDGQCFVRGKDGAMYPFSTEVIRLAGTRMFADRPEDVLNGGYVINISGEDIELEAAVYAVVAKGDVETGKQIICVGDKEIFEAEPQTYSKVAFMSHNTNGNGEYVRATDGTYIKKSTLQIPAYKKAGLTANARIILADGGFEIVTDYVTLPNNSLVSLPDDRVVFNGTDWLFYDDQPTDGSGDGEPQKCTYSVERTKVDKFLVNNTIVDASLVQLSGGKYTYGGEEMAELTVNPVKVVTDAISYKQKPSVINFLPTNTQKQAYTLSQEEGKLTYTFHNEVTVREDGLQRVETDAERTYARFVYADRVVDYVIGDKEPVYKKRVHDGKAREIVRVASFEFAKTGSTKNGGMKFEFNPQEQNNVAEIQQDNVGNITSFRLGEEKVGEVEWKDGLLKAYTFRGCRVVIERGKRENQNSYIVTDEKGVQHRLGGLKGTKFAYLYIECNLVENLRDVKWIGGVISSFKLGEYEFSDIEWSEQTTITKCTIKHGNTTKTEVDVNDPQYGAFLKQMQLRITTQLRVQGFEPLLRTALLNQNAQGTSLNAEYVAGKSENGVAQAAQLETVKQALSAQKEFEKDPYATHIVDESGAVREVEDVQTTYDGVTDFVNEDTKKILEKLIGQNEVNYKKGDIGVKRSSGTQKTIDFSMQTGAMLCSTLILAPLGVLALAYAGMASAADRIKRSSEKHNIKRLNYDQVVGKLQENAVDKCKADINKLVRETNKAINHAKKEFSSSELPRILDRLKADFVAKYNEIAGTLEMLQKSSIESKFDLTKGGKITAENLLGMLASDKKRQEAVLGKFTHPDYEKCLKSAKNDSLENFLLSSLSEDDKADYKSKSAAEKAAILKAFKQDVAKDEAKSKELEKFSIKAQIEVMEKLGGRRGMIEAQKLRLDNLGMFLTDEQKAKYEAADKKGKKEILKTCKAELERKFTANGAKWGNVDEQLEAYKLSEEYRMAVSASKRKALLKQKRKEIISKSEKLSTNSVEVPERLTASGKNQADELSKAVAAYREACCAQMFTTGEIAVNSPLFSGNGHTPKAFDYNFLEGMTEADKALYVGKSIEEFGSTIVVEHTSMDKVEQHTAKCEMEIDKAKTLINASTQAIETTRDTINSANTYIESLQTWAHVSINSKEVIDRNCEQAERALNQVQDNVAISSEEQQVLLEINAQNRVEIEKCVEDATEKRDNARQDYVEEVEQKVNEVYIASKQQEDKQYLAAHQKQFANFIKTFKMEANREAEEKFLEVRDRMMFIEYKSNVQKTPEGAGKDDKTIMEMFWESREREAEQKCAWLRRKFDVTLSIQDNLIANENADTFDNYRKQVEENAQRAGKQCPSEEQIKCMFAEWFKAQGDFDAFINDPAMQAKLAQMVVADLEKLQAQQPTIKEQAVADASPSPQPEPQTEEEYYEEEDGLTL